MKIIKFLIKPLELLIFLSMLAALIYFRSIIFHSNVNQYVDSSIAYIEKNLEIKIPSHFSGDRESELISAVECESPDIIAVTKDVDAINDVEPEIIMPVSEASIEKEMVSSAEKVEVIDEVSEVIGVINKKIGSLFELNDSTPSADPVPEKESAADDLSLVNNSDNALSGNGEIVDNSKQDVKQILLNARQVFWQGNTRAAEQSYLDLIELDASNPDVYGELGNIYYIQGKWKQAGEAYYEAAVRVLEQNNNDQVVNRVGYLLRVIQGLDKESAEKLRNKISG